MAEITVDGVSDDEGHVYGLPLYLEGFNFCYNTKLFEQAGIEKLPTTLDELDAVCAQLESAGIAAIRADKSAAALRLTRVCSHKGECDILKEWNYKMSNTSR